jgi:hypothetical protein
LDASEFAGDVNRRGLAGMHPGQDAGAAQRTQHHLFYFIHRYTPRIEVSIE